ncbi:MAG: YciI family protein [Cyanobacteriota bacterium]|nr:YciI family protein [Cyanobacteriota bacterium]
MKFVLWGTYCGDAPQKRTPFREEHLAGLRRQKERGVLLTIGPTEGCTHVFGLYEAANQEEVESLVKNDIYWREGIWTAVEVHPWIQAL